MALGTLFFGNIGLLITPSGKGLLNVALEPMKIVRILFLLLFASAVCTTTFAQQDDLDLTKVLADPQTLTFNDGKHTVTGYIYSQLTKKSKCCGNDAIYLDVRIDASGGVTEIRTLTGKNDCYKKSVMDIVRDIRWKSDNNQALKPIYFEVKPVKACPGTPEDNTYVNLSKTPMEGPGTVSTEAPKTVSAGDKAVADKAAAEKKATEAMAQDKVAQEAKARMEAELKAKNSADTKAAMDSKAAAEAKAKADAEAKAKAEAEAKAKADQEAKAKAEAEAKAKAEAQAQAAAKARSEAEARAKANAEAKAKAESETRDKAKREEELRARLKAEFMAQKEVEDKAKAEAAEIAKDRERLIQEERLASQKQKEEDARQKREVEAQKKAEEAKLAKMINQVQEIKTYTSTGDKKPEQVHQTTHSNQNGPKFNTPQFAEERGIAVYIKSKLRSAGVCGLAHAIAEVTVEPGGNVVEYRIFRTNSDAVARQLPEILNSMKFKPETVRFRQNVYVEFKADIVCDDRKDKLIDLNSVNDYLQK